MFFFRICVMAANSLRANLMRSVLACVGVIIGVAAVVSAMSILEGSRRTMLGQLEGLGADQVIVSNGSSSRRRSSRAFSRPSLTPEDAQAIARLPSVASANPESTLTAQIKYFQKNVSATVLATGADYAKMNNYEAVAGRFLSSEDVRGARKYCVLGAKVAEELYGETPAVGTRIRIEGRGFTVIGVMESKGFVGLRNVDDQVVIPVTVGRDQFFGSKYVQMITVQAADSNNMDSTIEEIKRCLRLEHGVRAGREDDFQIFTRQQATDAMGAFVKIFAIVLGSIAGISLVVGGIGIMNIMLVSVTERTREIGVRMAVGARRGDIMTQFLIEAGVVSIFGGLFGVLFGFEFTHVLENMTNKIFETYTSTFSIMLALAMATLTGIISGIYPAFRAAGLDPVEALRYE